MDRQKQKNWRKECFNQELIFAETVDARLTVDADGTKQLSIGQSFFAKLSWWESVGDRLCLDIGQDWFLDDVHAKLAAAKKEFNL